jgi:hypothetical protein
MEGGACVVCHVYPREPFARIILIKQLHKARIRENYLMIFCINSNLCLLIIHVAHVLLS